MHRKCRYFLSDQHLTTRSGWRKPAVACDTSLQVICDARSAIITFSEPRRADARRSWSLSVRPSPNDARFSRYSVGVTNHGGLTPGALDRMCVCASQKAVFHGRTIVQQSRAGGVKSGGRKPPVANETPLQSTTAHPRRHAWVQPRAGGVSPPWFGKRACR
jgi:hypothetical protein